MTDEEEKQTWTEISGLSVQMGKFSEAIKGLRASNTADHERIFKRFDKIEKDQTLYNRETHNIGTQVAAIQERCIDRGKRDSRESRRVDTIAAKAAEEVRQVEAKILASEARAMDAIEAVEGRVQVQEVTGTHHIAEIEGRRKLLKTIGQLILGIFAVLGVATTIYGAVRAASPAPPTAANRPVITIKDAGPAPVSTAPRR